MALPSAASAAALPAFMMRVIKRKEAPSGAQGSNKASRVVAEAEEAAEEQAKKKGKKGGASKNDVLEQLVQVLARLVLTNSNDLRELTGMLFTTHLVPVTFSLAAQALVAGKQYQEMVQEQKIEKNKSRGSNEDNQAEAAMDTTSAADDLGAPHIFIAMMAIQAMINDSTLVNMEEHAALLAVWKLKVEGKSEEDVHSIIRVFRARKPQKQSKQKGLTAEYVKITLCMDPMLEAPITSLLRKIGSIRKSGKAPRGYLEREASSLLNRMTKDRPGSN